MRKNRPRKGAVFRFTITYINILQFRMLHLL